jgi:hypothetical protein
MKTLRLLVEQAWAEYTLLDAQKAARHCRETMAAYRTVGAQQASLATLREVEIKMKGHRRVFDTSDNLLKLAANMELTVKQKLAAHRTKVARESKVRRDAKLARCVVECKESERKRSRQRAMQSDELVLKSKHDAQLRKSKMLTQPSCIKQPTLKDLVKKMLK